MALNGWQELTQAKFCIGTRVLKKVKKKKYLFYQPSPTQVAIA